MIPFVVVSPQVPPSCFSFLCVSAPRSAQGVYGRVRTIWSHVGQTCPTVTMLWQYVMGISSGFYCPATAQSSIFIPWWTKRDAFFNSWVKFTLGSRKVHSTNTCRDDEQRCPLCKMSTIFMMDMDNIHLNTSASGRGTTCRDFPGWTWTGRRAARGYLPLQWTKVSTRHQAVDDECQARSEGDILASPLKKGLLSENQLSAGSCNALTALFKCRTTILWSIKFIHRFYWNPILSKTRGQCPYKVHNCGDKDMKTWLAWDQFLPHDIFETRLALLHLAPQSMHSSARILCSWQTLQCRITHRGRHHLPFARVAHSFLEDITYFALAESHTHRQV